MLATNIQVLSPTSIRVVAPHMTGSSSAVIDVIVQNPDGQSTFLSNGYTYLDEGTLTITQQPVNQTASVGGTASFSAQAGGNPAPTVQWQFSVDGNTWVNIQGANFSTYTTPSLLMSYSGTRYRAVFTNSAGQVITNAALLTVQSITQLPPLT